MRGFFNIILDTKRNANINKEVTPNKIARIINTTLKAYFIVIKNVTNDVMANTPKIIVNNNERR